MDRILPIDLERARLRKSLFGYARKETDGLILGAAKTMEEVLVENDRLRQELDLFRLEIGRMRAQEDTLKDTLVVAQRAADDTRAAAQRTADAMIDEARLAAQSERQAAQEKLSELRWEIERLESDRRRFKEEFRHLLDRYREEAVGEPALTILQESA